MYFTPLSAVLMMDKGINKKALRLFKIVKFIKKGGLDLWGL